MKKIIISILLSILFCCNSYARVINTIIEVDSSLDVSDPSWQIANLGVLYELSRLDAEWPYIITPGTTVYLGRKIITAKIDISDSVADPLALVNSMFIVYGLNWKILAMQEFYSTNGDPVEAYKPVENIVMSYIDEKGVYAGFPPAKIGTLEKSKAWLHEYGFQAPWVWAE